MPLSFFFFFTWMTSSVSADVTHYFSTIKHDPKALYDFFLKMPKGGELHYHLTGGASPEVMLSLAPKGDYCMDSTTFTILPDRKTCQKLPLNKLRKNSPIYNKILQAWSMKDFHPIHESGHDHFFAIFFKFNPLASNHTAELLVDVIKRAAQQHEHYLEVMVLPDRAQSSRFGQLISQHPHLIDKQQRLLSNPKFLENIQQTVKESANLIHDAHAIIGCHSSSTLPACKLTIKLQYIILREQPLNQFFAQALNGFVAASRSPDIVGINLVQAEDGSISLRDYHKQMIILSFLHQAYPNVHIALHAGEITPQTLGSNNNQHKELRYHIHDAIFTGHAERIGHGVDIQYESNADELLNHMSKAAIPVEINLTSNEKILEVSGNQHPITTYLAHHVPVVLSTDDEGILRTNLTQEYVNATIRHELDYQTIKTINRNTLTYSFLPGKSLWTNPELGLRTDECQFLDAPTCLAFIAIHEKARHQWALEKELNAFENHF